MWTNYWFISFVKKIIEINSKKMFNEIEISAHDIKTGHDE